MSWDTLELSARGEAIRFAVHVRPRASRRGILGVRAGALEVAVNAPPAENAANEELTRLIAEVLEVRRADVAIAVGASSRSKVLEVAGMDPARAVTLLQGAARKPG